MSYVYRDVHRTKVARVLGQIGGMLKCLRRADLDLMAKLQECEFGVAQCSGTMEQDSHKVGSNGGFH